MLAGLPSGNTTGSVKSGRVGVIEGLGQNEGTTIFSFFPPH
jgi:hypothetical protein